VEAAVQGAPKLSKPLIGQTTEGFPIPHVGQKEMKETERWLIPATDSIFEFLSPELLRVDAVLFEQEACGVWNQRIVEVKYDSDGIRQGLLAGRPRRSRRLGGVHLFRSRLPELHGYLCGASEVLGG